MIEIIGSISSVMAIAGVVLNNRMRIECFYLWWVSNAIFAGIHLHAGIWSLAARDVVFLVLAVHGFICWRRKQQPPKTMACPHVPGIFCLADEDCSECLHTLPRAESAEEIETRIRYGCTYPSCGDCQECLGDE
jgi:hypothetical protein